MKTRLRPLLPLLLFLPLFCLGPLISPAGNPAAPVPAPVPAYDYTGEISGLSCSACFRMVRTSLARMPGVTDVKIVPGKLPGSASLEIKSSSPDLNRGTAIQALGEDAETFPVQSLRRSSRPGVETLRETPVFSTLRDHEISRKNHANLD
ncbi:MAG: heavy metal-associated domain-containing protein [Verrucomicrobiota bacterium]